MEEKKEVKEQLLKLIKINIITFATIFIVFAMSIFGIIQATTFQSAYDSLYRSKETLQNLSAELDDLNNLFGNIPQNDGAANDIFNNYQERTMAKKIVNPNITIIFRNFSGDVVAEESGRLETYISNIEFDSRLCDKIYDIKIDGKYNYKVLNFKIDNASKEDEIYFIQLLINVDSETYTVENYMKILCLSVFVGIGISVIASYMLSKRIIKPLQENMDKQREFVQNVSHELRTPLTIIQAKQELLLQEPNAKIIDKSEDIGLTLSESKRLGRLVKDLLVLSRADSNKMSIQKEKVNLDQYLEGIVSPYKELAEIENKKLILDFNYNLDVSIDTNKIYQLMVILIDNALKYTEEGDTVTIKTYLKDNKCFIEVQDTGIGVSDEGLKRIFERFYREDKARSRETGGTGLGLSIADMIVSAHNGTIKAIHNTPKGTCFIVRLPK